MKPSRPAKRPSFFQFSLGTFLLVLVSVALVAGMVAEEIRLTDRLMGQVNRYITAYMHRGQGLTRTEVRAFFDAPPTPDSAGRETEVFRWHGWLLTHEFHISFAADGHPTRTMGGKRPRLGLGAAVLAGLLVFWAWRWRQWAIRRRSSSLTPPGTSAAD
jgi:hypothetical protein